MASSIEAEILADCTESDCRQAKLLCHVTGNGGKHQASGEHTTPKECDKEEQFESKRPNGYGGDSNADGLQTTRQNGYGDENAVVSTETARQKEHDNHNDAMTADTTKHKDDAMSVDNTKQKERDNTEKDVLSFKTIRQNEILDESKVMSTETAKQKEYVDENKDICMETMECVDNSVNLLMSTKGRPEQKCPTEPVSDTNVIKQNSKEDVNLQQVPEEETDLDFVVLSQLSNSHSVERLRTCDSSQTANVLLRTSTNHPDGENIAQPIVTEAVTECPIDSVYPPPRGYQRVASLAPALESKPPSYMWLALFTIFFNFIIGLIALVIAMQSDHEYWKENIIKARKLGRVVKVLCLVAIATTSVAILVISIVFGSPHE